MPKMLNVTSEMIQAGLSVSGLDLSPQTVAVIYRAMRSLEPRRQRTPRNKGVIALKTVENAKGLEMHLQKQSWAVIGRFMKTDRSTARKRVLRYASYVRRDKLSLS